MRITSAVLLLAAIIFEAPSALHAGESLHRCQEKICCCTKLTTSRNWKVLESQNFRVHFTGSDATAKSVVPLCEKSCHAVRERWLAATEQAKWTVKCGVYLYRTAAEFERHAQAPAALWGFADLAVGDGKVWMRALHMRTDNTDQLNKVLVHELTHVVLAERFTNRPIPRWADEGIAVVSEPPARQRAFAGTLGDEASKRRLMSLKDLTRLKQVPQDERQGELFYGESGALIEYLIKEQKLTEAQVLKFVEDCDSRGWDKAVATYFPKTSPSRIETAWNGWLIERRDTLLADDVPAHTLEQSATLPE